MNLFARASAGLSLTPGERAFLKLVDGFVVTALGAALAAGAQVLSAGGVVDWRKVAAVAAVAFGTSLALTVKKFFTAQGDVRVTALAGDVVTKLESVRIPFTAPHSMTATVTTGPVNTASSAPASSGV